MAMKAHNIFRNALQTSANQCRKHPCLVRADVQAMTIRPIADRSGMSPLDGSLYNFSRGRFVCNERQEMAQRYVRFDTEKLGAAAASAIGSASCVNLEKYPDGMYNRAMLLTMCDGKQAVAKIPNPNSGRPHLTTASEVATMDFMRNTLGIPAPRVYAWCNDAQETPVGAEYIVMEKVEGVPLDTVYGTMPVEDRFAVTKTISNYQKTWASIAFETYGGLYYARDFPNGKPLRFTDGNGAVREDANFSVGPTTGREWNDDGRRSISFDRGPWCRAEQYLRAVGKRELSCVKELAALPKSQLTLCGPGTYEPTRDKKIKAINCYLDMADLATPTDDALRKACLWHGDLHSENVFVNPLNTTEVTAIIDWQATEIAPLFVQTRQPHFMDYEGPQLPGTGRPHLPVEYEQLPSAEQARLRSLFYLQSLRALYRTLMQKSAPDIWKSFEFQETPTFDLLLFARNLLVDGEATYMAHLMEALESDSAGWIHSSKDGAIASLSLEKEEIMADAEGALRGMDAMQGIRNSLGDLFPERGVVKPEQYDLTKDALRQTKQEVIAKFAHTDEEKAAWEESWPFDD
ncbi:hypothetical protein D0865_03403 [Hortaea werneckii]|uniref:Aminoglycoside phosphotransferase domain-containing protein n=1 Tax=Hortaea werneckii TaxID=91943 RepID=A0A3M7E1V4_HORWE|nr:hypothetical protein D0865_03403 [Hortaea werneckii]RMY70413.1 hypothetical protein D0863_05794 [Hortaea werneckii]